MFDFIAYPFANLMLFLYNFLGQQTVVAIAALTILIRLLLLPLTIRQQQSARKMQELQPEIAKLQKKYGKDKERLSQEQMKLYKEMGINPMGGCLPMLIQLPIMIGLYQAIMFCVPATPLQLFQFSHHIYKWLPGVVGLVPLQNMFLGMDLGQPPGMPWWGYALPVLVFATSWLQQKLLTPPTTRDDKSQAGMMGQQMQQMQIMMPLMFGFISLQYAVGLSIYFIISNLIGIAQYYFIRRGQGDESDKSKKAVRTNGN
jgi:YidC/Oxa1 family membrane protein insertase